MIPPEDIAAAAETLADDDPRFTALLELLPEAWAHLPADDGGLEAAAVFVRAAWGAGYQTALERRLVDSR